MICEMTLTTALIKDGSTYMEGDALEPCVFEAEDTDEKAAPEMK